MYTLKKILAWLNIGWTALLFGIMASLLVEEGDYIYVPFLVISVLNALMMADYLKLSSKQKALQDDMEKEEARASLRLEQEKQIRQEQAAAEQLENRAKARQEMMLEEEQLRIQHKTEKAKEAAGELSVEELQELLQQKLNEDHPAQTEE